MEAGGRWASGNWYWVSGMFPASSFTLFFSLHLSSPESSLNGNSIKASLVVAVTGWRGSGLEFLPTADVAAGFRQEEPDAFHLSLV